MIPFRVLFQPGIPVSEQAVYAATRAILSGQLRPGDAFPSVRSLSRELKINPNTAHKVISTLIAEGLLQTQPGIGTVVAEVPKASEQARARLLGQRVEELVVEAKRVGIALPALQQAIAQHWDLLRSETDGDAATPVEGKPVEGKPVEGKTAR